MELQQEVLEQLKCNNCTGYLSSAPVLLTTSGQSVCGRCPAPEEEPAARNQPYELLAQHVAFPCKYQEEGCLERVVFGQLQAHEDGCDYRNYVCPVLAIGACDWLGPRSALMEHCKAEHPDSIIENSHVFRHNISASSVQAYIMTLFSALFLVHTKVCTTTRKIYHSVRLLGHPEHADSYNFHIVIERDDVKLLYKGQVAPQGCLYIKENISVRTDINGLLSILGGYGNTTFKLTINQVKQLPNKLAEMAKCAKCSACVVSLAYRDTAGWYCEVCTPSRRPCENSASGCTYTDIPSKAKKHANLYCDHINDKCWECGELLAGSRAAHSASQHLERVRRAGTAWRHTGTDNKKNRYMRSEVGVLVCVTVLCPSEFTFLVCSPLSCKELHLYECVVVLEHPTTAHTRRFTATPQYDTQVDWELRLAADDTALYCQDNAINITVYIVKKP